MVSYDLNYQEKLRELWQSSYWSVSLGK